MFLVAVLVVLLLGRRCSKAPPASPPAAAEAEAGPAADGTRAFLVGARIIALDAAALATPEGVRLLALEGTSSVASAQAEADAAALLAAGTARQVSSPRLKINEGRAGVVSVELSTPGGAGTPRTTRSDTLEIVCTRGAGGAIHVQAQLKAEQQKGRLEHAAGEVGLALGDRGLVAVDAEVPPGRTAVGVRVLGAGNDLGGALVLFVTPAIVAPEPKPDAEPEPAPGG
jgi:hypothetical protein